MATENGPPTSEAPSPVEPTPASPSTAVARQTSEGHLVVYFPMSGEREELTTDEMDRMDRSESLDFRWIRLETPSTGVTSLELSTGASFRYQTFGTDPYSPDPNAGRRSILLDLTAGTPGLLGFITTTRLVSDFQVSYTVDFKGVYPVYQDYDPIFLEFQMDNSLVAAEL
jgi:hypothetical protein